MLFKVFCKINYSNQLCMSVQRSLFNESRNVMLSRGFVTLPKSSNVKCITNSLTFNKNKLATNELMCRILLKRKQSAVYLGCHSFSNHENPKVEENEKKEAPKAKLSFSQTFKKLYKECAYILIPVHLITSAIWYGSFYYLVASGVDVPALLELMKLPDSWVDVIKNSGGGYYIAAYALYKLATPLRYAATAGFTTLTVRYLSRMGLLRKNTDNLKKLYTEKKDALKNTCQKKMQVHKNDFMKTKKEVTRQFEEVKQGLHQTILDSKHDLKEGFESGADEWKMIGRSIKKSIGSPFKK